jgi:hypothetical protein
LPKEFRQYNPIHSKSQPLLFQLSPSQFHKKLETHLSAASFQPNYASHLDCFSGFRPWLCVCQSYSFSSVVHPHLIHCFLFYGQSWYTVLLKKHAFFMLSFLQHLKSTSVTVIFHAHLMSCHFILQFFISQILLRELPLPPKCHQTRSFWRPGHQEKKAWYVFRMTHKIRFVTEAYTLDPSANEQPMADGSKGGHAGDEMRLKANSRPHATTCSSSHSGDNTLKGIAFPRDKTTN